MTESFGDEPATLLLVEDDEQVRGLIRSILATERVHVVEAGTGSEGLQIATSLGRPIDVLLTDMLLPELSGYDLAIALREKFPALRIIMITGYIEGEIVMKGMEELRADFLDKPFRAADLKRLVSAAIDRKAVQTNGV